MPGNSGPFPVHTRVFGRGAAVSSATSTNVEPSDDALSLSRVRGVMLSGRTGTTTAAGGHFGIGGTAGSVESESYEPCDHRVIVVIADARRWNLFSSPLLLLLLA